jgi:hypothetical protein
MSAPMPKKYSEHRNAGASAINTPNIRELTVSLPLTWGDGDMVKRLLILFYDCDDYFFRDLMIAITFALP